MFQLTFRGESGLVFVSPGDITDMKALSTLAASFACLGIAHAGIYSIDDQYFESETILNNQMGGVPHTLTQDFDIGPFNSLYSVMSGSTIYTPPPGSTATC